MLQEIHIDGVRSEVIEGGGNMYAESCHLSVFTYMYIVHDTNHQDYSEQYIHVAVKSVGSTVTLYITLKLFQALITHKLVSHDNIM